MYYKTINGFTKESMKKAIRAGNNGKKAVGKNGLCVYLTDEGNKCAVGCFIPDGHPVQTRGDGVGNLLETHEDLNDILPLEKDGLIDMQNYHDKLKQEINAQDALCSWIDKYVEE